jgi:flagellar biosynthesis/type III secretory pathway protein FliH
MARVIKAGANTGTAKPARPATRMLAQADLKGAIKADVVLAKQEAAELLKRADEERREILNEGKRQAALAREEAATRAAAAAFAQAAEEALVAFRKRADRYGEAAGDIRALALAIAKKVLGAEPDLGHKDVERILQRGLLALRAKRKVRVQVSPGRRAEIAYERPHMMKAVSAAPDLLMEDADDVREGFARIVTEVGGALCAEDSALDAVALAVNVKETPRQRRTRTGRISVDGATGEGGSVEMNEGPTGKVQAQVRPAARAVVHDVVHAVDDDSVEDAAVDDSSVDDDASLPDAAVVEDDFDDDATRALPARVARPRDVSVGGTVPRPALKPAPVRVEVNNRAATRAIAVDAPRSRVEPRATPLDVAGDDDDLDLFTDARPQRR